MLENIQGFLANFLLSLTLSNSLVYDILRELAQGVQFCSSLVKPGLECCFIRPSLLFYFIFLQKEHVFSVEHVSWSFILLFQCFPFQILHVQEALKNLRC